MAEPETNPSEIQIRCPNCGQRFKVGSELRGKLVECGSCEQRFRVNDDVVLRSRKFYPGEAKRDAHLERFARAPIATEVPVGFETANYGPAPKVEAIEPPSMQRVMAGGVGVVGLGFTLLLFVLSIEGGGPLGAVPTQHRLLFAGFMSVLGSSFILYANRRRMLPAALGCVLVSAALLAIPVVFPGPDESLERKVPPGRAGGGEETAAAPDKPGNAADPYAEYKEEIRYEPVAAEIEAAGSPDKVTAIWLRGIQQRHKFTVEDFLLRVTGADHSSHMYPRGDHSNLMVLTGMEEEIEVTAQHCKRIGNIERIILPLRVIEVNVASDRFSEGPLDRLADTTGDAFYALNLRELDSIDLGRVERAVERLSTAEPKQFRSDVVDRMIALLKEVPPELADRLATALGRWARPDDGAEAAVLGLMRAIDADGKKAGEGMIRFLVGRGVAEVQPFLHKQWEENPDSWEQIYGDLGSPARGPMVAALAEEKISMRDSAVRILGRVGNAATIPILEAMRTDKDQELDAGITRAISQIRQRDSD